MREHGHNAEILLRSSVRIYLNAELFPLFPGSQK